MTTRTCYWLLGLVSGVSLCYLPSLEGPAVRGECGMTFIGFFFYGFVPMIVMGEIISIAKWCVRRRVAEKSQVIAEDLS